MSHNSTREFLYGGMLDFVHRHDEVRLPRNHHRFAVDSSFHLSIVIDTVCMFGSMADDKLFHCMLPE